MKISAFFLKKRTYTHDSTHLHLFLFFFQWPPPPPQRTYFLNDPIWKFSCILIKVSANIIQYIFYWNYYTTFNKKYIMSFTDIASHKKTFHRYCFSQKDLSHIALSKVENLSIWAMTRFSLIILCRNYSRINSWAILQSSRNIWQISSSGSTLFSRLALTVTWWYLIIFHSNINFNCGIFFFFGFGVALKSCQLFEMIYIPCSKLKFKKETCFFASLCHVLNDFSVYSNVHNDKLLRILVWLNSSIRDFSKNS